MEIESRLSHLIAKYKRQLEKDPSSRVFAPLAECYRKAGMMPDALVTLRDGLKQNPDSVLGHIGLAQCYSDQGEFEKVYETLLPFKQSNLDNIKLLRLFAESCLKINKNEDALEAYKYILFLNPRNSEAIEAVSSLEDGVYSSFSDVEYHNSNIREQFPIEKLEDSKETEKSVDGWEAIDFSEQTPTNKDLEEEPVQDNSLDDGWSMEPITNDVLNDNKEDEEGGDSEDSSPLYDVDDDRSFKVLTSEAFQRPKSVSRVEEQNESKPLITHTLVDLYCAQGHYEQAHQLLKKILELNPHDERTALKMKEVEEFLEFEDSALENNSSDEQDDDESEDGPELDEEQAHAHLASLVESKVQVSKRHRVTEVEQRLWRFHEKLSERARR